MEQSMNVGMQDPNNSSFLGTLNEGPFAGKNTPDYGKSKITKSASAPHSSEMVGYGYMSPALKDISMAPSGENSSGIPAAQPIQPMTFGDPLNSDNGFRSGEPASYGFSAEHPGHSDSKISSYL